MNAHSNDELVSIYISENARIHSRSAYLAILEYLRDEGATNVIAIRGIAGIDSKSQIHAAGVMTLSVDLPVKVEWTDSADRVQALLPGVLQLIGDGLVTMQDVRIVKRAVAVREDVLNRGVKAIMTRDVASVSPQMPLADVVSLLLEGGYHSVPVVDDGLGVVGIVTNGDLLRNTSLPVRLGLQPTLTDEQVKSDFHELQAGNRQVGEIMSMPVVTISEDSTVRQAGAVMVEQDLKRLPVLDKQHKLVGIVSRVDIMAAISSAEAVSPDVYAAPHGDTIAKLMNPNAPTIHGDADLEQILHALEQSRQQRAVVVDSDRHVLGVITDGDLLRRSMYGKHPSLRQRLRGLITGASSAPFVLPSGNECAAELMTSPPITVQLDASLGDALGLMLTHHLKRLPVVDAEGVLVGVLGRASILRGLMDDDETSATHTHVG